VAKAAAGRISDTQAMLATAVVAVLVGAAVGFAGIVPALAILAAGGLFLCIIFPVPSGFFLLFIPYLYNVGAVSVGGVVDIRILEIGWLAVAAGLFFQLARGKRLPADVIPAPIVVTGVLFLLWELFSALMAGGVAPVVEVVQTLYLFVVAMLGAKITRERGTVRIDRALTTAGVVFLLVSAVGVLGYLAPALATPYYVVTLGPGFSVANALPPSLGELTSYGLARYSLINLGPVATAAVSVMVLVLAASRMLDDERAGTTLVARLVSVVAAMSLILSLSRAGWLIGMAAVLWLVLRSGHRKAVPATAVLVLALSIIVSLPAVQGRLEDIRNPEEGSNRSHTRLYVTAIYMANQAPIVGWGPGNFSEIASSLQVRGDLDANIDTSDAHNFVLQEAAEAGWVGAALALLLLGRILLYAYQRLRRESLSWYGVYMAAVALILMGLTMNIFRTEVLWSLVGLLLGIAASPPSSESAPVLAEDVA